MGAVTRDQVIGLIYHEMAEAGSLRALARRWGVSACYLSRACSGLEPPGPAILRHLGLEGVRSGRAVVGYRAKGTER